jgi:hypothetical protein
MATGATRPGFGGILPAAGIDAGHAFIRSTRPECGRRRSQRGVARDDAAAQAATAVKEPRS